MINPACNEDPFLNSREWRFCRLVLVYLHLSWKTKNRRKLLILTTFDITLIFTELKNVKYYDYPLKRFLVLAFSLQLQEVRWWSTLPALEEITNINPCPEQLISIIFFKYSFFLSFYFRLKRYAVGFIQAFSLYSFQAALNKTSHSKFPLMPFSS